MNAKYVNTSIENTNLNNKKKFFKKFQILQKTNEKPHFYSVKDK